MFSWFNPWHTTNRFSYEYPTASVNAPLNVETEEAVQTVVPVMQTAPHENSEKPKENTSVVPMETQPTVVPNANSAINLADLVNLSAQEPRASEAPIPLPHPVGTGANTQHHPQNESGDGTVVVAIRRRDVPSGSFCKPMDNQHSQLCTGAEGERHVGDSNG